MTAGSEFGGRAGAPANATWQTNRLGSDKKLLAPKAVLAVRQDLHPAIQYAVLSAAAKIHAEAGIFQRADQFATAEPTGLP
jgi:hypothetical protein